MEKIEKKRLIIFIAVAYGITYFMGIFMYIGFKKEVDLSMFTMAQMLYPAAGVMLGTLLTNPKEKPIPRAAFIITLLITVISMILSILAVFVPMKDIEAAGQSIGMYYLIGQSILVVFSIVVYILFCVAGKEKRINAGLERKNIKISVLVIGLFLILYFFRVILSFGLQQIISGDGISQFQEWLKIFTNPTTWLSIASLPMNFFFVFICFLGEEYGWRYYLQPIMQKKFGLKGGVLLLGIVWGLWHLPIDLFYYTTTTGAQMVVNQIITCIAYSIFFGFAYMKTQNIWVPVILHFLNNNLVPVISGNFSSDVLENQSMSWSDIPVALVLMLVYILFIFTKEYKKKNEENTADIQVSRVS